MYSYRVLLLCLYGLVNTGHSCNTAHIAAWTLSMEKGVATAKCCPKNGASVVHFFCGQVALLLAQPIIQPIETVVM